MREKDPEWIVHHEKSDARKNEWNFHGKSFGRFASIRTEAAAEISYHQNIGL